MPNNTIIVEEILENCIFYIEKKLLYAFLYSMKPKACFYYPNPYISSKYFINFLTICDLNSVSNIYIVLIPNHRFSPNITEEILCWR